MTVYSRLGIVIQQGYAYIHEQNGKSNGIRIAAPGADNINQGADTDLGNDAEFYSQLRLEYKLENGAKIGLGIGHISNADIGDHNPGAETAYLNYNISL